MNEQAIGQLADSKDDQDDLALGDFIGVVELSDYKEVLLTARHDLLMVFLRRDDAFPGYFEKIADLEGKAESGLRVRIVSGESVDELMRVFGVGGTPAFLLFRNGREIGRFLGDADPGRIIHNM